MFKTGEVVRFRSDVAGKVKFHLCISMDDHFIFLNSPKSKRFIGDFEIQSSDISGLIPTPEGKSIASCSMVMQFTKQDLTNYSATCVGSVKPAVLKALLLFVDGLTTIETETKNQIIDGLGETVGL
jgi:hypothetical protein